MEFGKIRRIHFVGIGGIGMSGIAEILTNYDLEISGCDAAASSTTRRLERHGIPVSIGHDPSHVHDVDLVVMSSAIRRNHPEIAKARELRVPVIRRAEMLGELTRLKKSIGIAGTHGKTTTSAMTALVLAEGGLDPTMIVGGVLRSIDTNAKLGTGEWLVVEADEYDRTFLRLHPRIGVITNVEADHLDIYDGIDDIVGAFRGFAAQIPFYGLLIGFADDDRVEDVLRDAPCRTRRYGFSDRAEVRASEPEVREGRTWFEVIADGEALGEFSLAAPGRHNVANALASIAVALELGLDPEAIRRALSQFGGVERRFQVHGEYRGAVVVDDYAHHPTEIRATLQAARSQYPDRRVVALFQPHLYSRTRDFQHEFAEALMGADLALVAPLYPSREEPIDGVDASLISTSAASRGGEQVRLIEGSLQEITDALRGMLESNDVLLTLGAGNVHEVAETLAGDAQ